MKDRFGKTPIDAALSLSFNYFSQTNGGLGK